MTVHESVLDAIGETPLFRLTRLGRGIATPLYAKAEFLNIGGSVKDRAALSMVLQAERDGLLRPGGTIVEATSGNIGIGLAIIGRQRGYRVIVGTRFRAHGWRTSTTTRRTPRPTWRRHGLSATEILGRVEPAALGAAITAGRIPADSPVLDHLVDPLPAVGGGQTISEAASRSARATPPPSSCGTAARSPSSPATSWTRPSARATATTRPGSPGSPAFPGPPREDPHDDHRAVRGSGGDASRHQRDRDAAARAPVGAQVHAPAGHRRRAGSAGRGRPVRVDVVEPAGVERGCRAGSAAQGPARGAGGQPAVHRPGTAVSDLGRRPEPGASARRRRGNRRGAGGHRLSGIDDPRLRRRRPRGPERRRRGRVARPGHGVRRGGPQPSRADRGRAWPATARGGGVRARGRHPRPDRARRHQAAAAAGRRPAPRAV
ncbi:hypothetical protein; tryptophan synthase beta subunit-like PLP-dependent enzymes domain [Frankia alni ACN14a]|uniref:Tryptophan synthase beta chain-like PALP domain-containing protein n=1 Tax=Frankia alni (strain DSM 45986 / CECT 9034 / ACN14a) TaxID=326424 RepID=Q0RLF9_FRAAA|nr:hypothetical protein; tryptophan synthase beta subunit-like PLP-dependent enzymes domain [Frankia alni ACN14a]